MKSTRLAVFAALVVGAVAAIAWIAGPVEVGHPRFELELDLSPLEQDQTPEPEPLDCEENGRLCGEATGEVSDAVTVGTLVFALMLLTAAIWLAAKLIRKLFERAQDISLPTPMDETIDAHIREALRNASQQAAHEMESVPAGEAADAVVASWVALEQAAERVGTPRDSAATPTEFTVELLREHDADPRAVAALLDLYHQARFGSSPLPDSASATAVEALRTIADSLSSALTEGAS